MKHNIPVFLALIVGSYFFVSQAVTTGSTTALGAQGLVTYSGATNTINPGALMNAGLTLNAGAAVTWNSFFPLLGPITLNGGSIIQQIDLTLAGNATLVNGGTFTANLSAVIFPYDNIPFVIGTSPTTFDTSNVVFNSPINLSTTLIFKSTGGVNVLNANGNVINFLPGAAIEIAAGATLTIQNAILNGVAATQLHCQDNAGVLSLQNVTIVQDSNFTFTLGTLNILNDVEITGSTVFSYRSSNPLTIATDSMLFLDLGTTFSYDTTNASLLTFADVTSQLYFHGATLYATGTGINILKGTITLDQNSTFASEGTLGISIGNCSAINDTIFNVLPYAQLSVSQGLFNYKNVNTASFNMFNEQTILSMGTGTTLNLYRSLSGLGSTLFANNSTLGSGPTATLNMSSLQLGTLNLASLPAC